MCRYLPKAGIHCSQRELRFAKPRYKVIMEATTSEEDIAFNIVGFYGAQMTTRGIGLAYRVEYEHYVSREERKANRSQQNARATA
jgi:5-methylthioribose kinase